MPNKEFNPDDVRRIIAEQLKTDLGSVVDTADLTKDLGADSLDAAEITMELEDRYGLSIPTEDAAKMRTVRQAIDYVRDHYNP
jgi:acyl carrier protein